MSIRVVCPNGHVLFVDEAHAGRTGRCKMCGIRLTVPQIRKTPISEDEVLDFLGNEDDPGSSNILDWQNDQSGSGVLDPSASSSGRAPKKSCSKCHSQIDAGMHICPHCHTYIANVSEFND